MRLTALTPAPPTPTTRSSGEPGGRRRRPRISSSSARASREDATRPTACGSGRGAASRMFSGRSELKAWRRRSCGVGTCGVGSLGGASRAQRRVRVALTPAGVAAAGGSGSRRSGLGRGVDGAAGAGVVAARRVRRRPSVGAPRAASLRACGRARPAGPPACSPRLPLAIAREPPSRGRDRTAAAIPSGSYLSTDMPFTGASAKRIVLRMREANTRSPKFSSRISIASLAWTVRVSISVGQDALDRRRRD